MARRGDNIHKRKDGRWEGRYRKGRHPDGSILYGSLYGKSYSEVKEKLSVINSRLGGEHVCFDKDITFGKVLEQWMQNNRIRLKGGTINKYQNLIDSHIKPELGEKKLSELNSTVINQFLMQKLQNGCLQRSGGLSESYVKSISVVIISALGYAVKEKMCVPIDNLIYKPVSTKKELRILSLHEQKQLEHCLLCDIDQTKLGVLISLYTGLRIGEICALTWENVDLKNQIIKVRHTIARVQDSDSDQTKTCLIIDTPKTKASFRDIPIFSTLLPILTKMEACSTSEYVISTTDSFVRPRTYDYRFHRLLEESGISQINYHALRHTFATRCIEAGVDVKSLSEILGHSNVSITLNTYVHSSIKMKRVQLEKLNDFMAQSTGT